jgi:hypothetical protein
MKNTSLSEFVLLVLLLELVLDSPTPPTPNPTKNPEAKSPNLFVQSSTLTSSNLIVT